MAGRGDKLAAAALVTVQRCVITDWVPPPVLNGSRQRHWAVLAKEAKAVKTMAWASAKYAGWTYVPGRVRLDVTFVFPVKRARDRDNLYARCKHLADGLKGTFFEDDSVDSLDLHVEARVERGQKRTELVLESVDG